MSSSLPFIRPLHPGLSSSKIFIHRDVRDEEGTRHFEEGYIKVRYFLTFMDLWKPGRSFLPSRLRTDSTDPSPRIDSDGLVLVPIERYDAVTPEGRYDTIAFLQELDTTGFGLIPPFTRCNNEKHPEYQELNVVVASQKILLPNRSYLFVPLLV
jgi:hypothetical protein